MAVFTISSITRYETPGHAAFFHVRSRITSGAEPRVPLRHDALRHVAPLGRTASARRGPTAGQGQERRRWPAAETPRRAPAGRPTRLGRRAPPEIPQRTDRLPGWAPSRPRRCGSLGPIATVEGCEALQRETGPECVGEPGDLSVYLSYPRSRSVDAVLLVRRGTTPLGELGGCCRRLGLGSQLRRQPLVDETHRCSLAQVEREAPPTVSRVGGGASVVGPGVTCIVPCIFRPQCAQERSPRSG